MTELANIKRDSNKRLDQGICDVQAGASGQVGQEFSQVDATLTKDALIEMIREKVGFPVKEAKEILEIILEEVKLKLEEGKEVKISGFGKWTVKEKRSRPGRNPHTGDRIEISARRVVTFHPSDKLRDSVNKAYAERDGQ